MEHATGYSACRAAAYSGAVFGVAVPVDHQVLQQGDVENAKLARPRPGAVERLLDVHLHPLPRTLTSLPRSNR